MTTQPAVSTQTSVAVEHLFTLTAELAAPQTVESGPQGTRVIINVTGGSVQGARVRGTLLGPTGDWLVARPDGTLKLDVRASIRTDDGAIILMTYHGIGSPKAEGGASVRSAPLFETGDARYAWLNNIQAIGFGEAPATMERVTYEVFALK
ncbi:MAG TPA: DUF3237 domain-containing protein [Dehalococcoidia bacterium]|nr:DUF3237 domain-containing protein [Dehalococcoidia bacterium]